MRSTPATSSSPRWRRCPRASARCARILTNRPLALGLTGTAALATAGGTALALLGGASPAFAGWSPNPTRATHRQLAQADASCQSELPIQNLPLQLTDTRGPFTFEIYATDSAQVTCITGPSFTSASGAMSSAPITTPADQIDLSTDHTSGGDGDAYSFAEGRVGTDVAAATLTLDDGSTVQATVQNGWFVAWWPGSSDTQSATLNTTDDGTQTQTFHAAGAPCDPTQCTGGSLSGTQTDSSGSATVPANGPAVDHASVVSTGEGTTGMAYSYSYSRVGSGAASSSGPAVTHNPPPAPGSTPVDATTSVK